MNSSQFLNTKKVLVVNAGSSSLKWALFNFENLELLASGLAERIGLEVGSITTNTKSGVLKESQKLPNHQKAVDYLLKMWTKEGIINSLEEIAAIGFRVVHGGGSFSSAIPINQEVIDKIKEAEIFAPLHNPAALLSIKAFLKSAPKAFLTASFDTAFHNTIPPQNHLYAIPYELSQIFKIRRYGFHGLSHLFVTEALSGFLKKAKINFINLHLGNGASVCAIKDSLSFDTSMGMTPLEGLIMGTRSGNIDPAIFSFLETIQQWSISQIEEILNKKSGLLGISGVSNDLRDVEAKAAEGDSRSQLAIEMFAQRCANYIVEYANKIATKLDGIVFTAGIGENDASMREKICSKIFLKRVKLDLKKNKKPFEKITGAISKISSEDSQIDVYVIKTNEELVIAREARELFFKLLDKENTKKN